MDSAAAFCKSEQRNGPPRESLVSVELLHVTFDYLQWGKQNKRAVSLCKDEHSGGFTKSRVCGFFRGVNLVFLGRKETPLLLHDHKMRQTASVRHTNTVSILLF